jgi:hypothetical protein
MDTGVLAIPGRLYTFYSADGSTLEACDPRKPTVERSDPPCFPGAVGLGNLPEIKPLLTARTQNA